MDAHEGMRAPRLHPSQPGATAAPWANTNTAGTGFVLPTQAPWASSSSSAPKR